VLPTRRSPKAGRTATHAGRNGYLWIPAIGNQGQLKLSTPFVSNNKRDHVRLTAEGRPVIDESTRPGAKQGG